MTSSALPPLRLPWLFNIASEFRRQQGYQRIAWAMFMGALSALAYAPIDFFPILAITFPALIFLNEGAQTLKSSFFTGWAYAFGFFVFDIYWTAASMFVDIAHFWWVVPLALFALPAMFAIYYGVAASASRLFNQGGMRGALQFALLWFLADYARGNFFSGFPWNIEGYAFADFLPILQTVSLFGVYGLTLITLVVVCLPAGLAEIKFFPTNRLIVGFVYLIFLCLTLWGSCRLTYDKHQTVPHVRLRLVQPSISQKTKWQPNLRQQNFERLLSLSRQPAKKPLTAILWPETAAPFYLAEDREHRLEAASIVPKGGYLITGVLRHEETVLGDTHYFNSLIALNRDGEIEGTYDKAHLVPFGEYVPYRDIVPLPQLAGMGVDFSRGVGAVTLHLADFPPFSPFICYEAIFPNAVVNAEDPPRFLLNVTNDGWYGNTAGPYQHFAIARVRSVEQGLPLIRPANTGISGIVDAYGQIEGEIHLGEMGFLDGDLPVSLPDGTFFSRYKERTLWLIFAALFVFSPWLKGRPHSLAD